MWWTQRLGIGFEVNTHTAYSHSSAWVGPGHIKATQAINLNNSGFIFGLNWTSSYFPHRWLNWSDNYLKRDHLVNHETLRIRLHFPQMSQILARQARAAAACPPPATGGCVTTAAPSPRATDTSRMFNCDQILSIISYSDILILNNSLLTLQILVRWGYHTRLAP